MPLVFWTWWGSAHLYILWRVLFNWQKYNQKQVKCCNSFHFFCKKLTQQWKDDNESCVFLPPSLFTTENLQFYTPPIFSLGPAAFWVLARWSLLKFFWLHFRNNRRSIQSFFFGSVVFPANMAAAVRIRRAFPRGSCHEITKAMHPPIPGLKVNKSHAIPEYVPRVIRLTPPPRMAAVKCIIYNCYKLSKEVPFSTC